MIDNTIETKDMRLWIFDYDNPEWERVRELCLEEDNWLRANYTKERCKISDHKVFYIAYFLDGRPFTFGGIKEYTPDVARAFNRMYVFPYARAASKFVWHHGLMVNTILPALESALGFKYKLLFISMQMRDRKYNGVQRWWEFWKKSWFSWTSDWKSYDGLVQTYPSEDLTCYQNIVYRESDNYTFTDWNPKTMTYDEYAKKYQALLG
jgi:hypothetical protein